VHSGATVKEPGNEVIELPRDLLLRCCDVSKKRQRGFYSGEQAIECLGCDFYLEGGDLDEFFDSRFEMVLQDLEEIFADSQEFLRRCTFVSQLPDLGK